MSSGSEFRVWRSRLGLGFRVWGVGFAALLRENYELIVCVCLCVCLLYLGFRFRVWICFTYLCSQCVFSMCVPNVCSQCVRCRVWVCFNCLLVCLLDSRFQEFET